MRYGWSAMSRRRLLGFAAVIVALLAVLILTPASSMLLGLVSDPGEKAAAAPQDRRAGSERPKGAPSKIDRPTPLPKPTAEETEALLESTLIPEAHLDDLTLVQWVSSLNKLLERAGVDRHDLRVVLSHRVARHPLGSETRWNGRKHRNVSVSALLESITRGKSPIGYRVGEGTVEVGLWRGPEDESQSEAIVRAKLDQITIPIIDFDETTVQEARDFLISRCLELDDSTVDPTRKGLVIVIREPRTPARGPATAHQPEAEGNREGDLPIYERTLTLQSRNITAAKALDEITRGIGLQWKIDDFAIIISPADAGAPPESHPPPVPPGHDEPSAEFPDDNPPPMPCLATE